MSRPQLLLSPNARQRLFVGFQQLAKLLTPTLGPMGRTVLVQDEHPKRPPSILDDGALIARRFTGLPQRFESMGALLARQIAWTVEEAVGDGSTTAVVLAQSIIGESMRYITAGYNPMRLRIGLEKTLPVLQAALTEMAQPLTDPTHITTMATTITGDPTLGKLIEEVFDVVGAHGAIDVRRNYGVTHTREYIRGVFWNQGWVSSTFTTDAGTAVVKDPYILLTNRELSNAQDLVPLLEMIHERNKQNANKANAQKRGLVVIANGITGDALNLLVSNKVRDILPTLAIKTPGLGPEKTEILHDLAAVCGAQVQLMEAPTALQEVPLSALGQADEMQAIRSGFTLIGGKGRPAAVRERATDLRRQIPRAAYGRDRNRLLERSGKLVGGVALLKVGGISDSERTYLRERAKEAVNVIRLALDSGVVPGGGIAYANCVAALGPLCLPEDEAIAIPIMRKALVAPFFAMLRNSGHEPAPLLARLADQPPGFGYDLRTQACVNMVDAGIVDPLPVLAEALSAGVSGALMAITTDTLVSKPRHNRDEAVDFRV